MGSKRFLPQRLRLAGARSNEKAKAALPHGG
jgi:hypothetical protein